MNPLSKPDSLHFDGAEGWLMLGDHREAELEWNLIAPQFHRLPEVLSLKWSIQAAANNWQQASETAVQLCEAAPDQAIGWVNLAYSVRRKTDGGLKQAWSILEATFQRFPKDSIIPYNLSCYAAQMGMVNEAWEWLQKAAHIAGVAPIKAMALKDPDLSPLRTWIEKM
jgi:hypothetical protein